MLSTKPEAGILASCFFPQEWKWERGEKEDIKGGETLGERKKKSQLLEREAKAVSATGIWPWKILQERRYCQGPQEPRGHTQQAEDSSTLMAAFRIAESSF